MKLLRDLQSIHGMTEEDFYKFKPYVVSCILGEAEKESGQGNLDRAQLFWDLFTLTTAVYSGKAMFFLFGYYELTFLVPHPPEEMPQNGGHQLGWFIRMYRDWRQEVLLAK